MAGIPKVTVAPDRVTVRPGERTGIEVTIQNTGRSVEHYDTTIVGLPGEEAYRCVPPTVKLRPGESGTVSVDLGVAERPAPDAGLYTLGVLVRSPYQRQVARCEELRLEVQPAPGVSIQAAPEHATGGGSARYALRLANDGNTPLDVTLHGTDPEGLVSFSFRPRAVRVAPNASAPAQVTVRAPAPWSGQEARRTLTVRATATGDLTSEKQLTFVQRPRIPRGPVRFVGIAVAVGVLAAATLAGALIRNAGNNAKPNNMASQGALPGPPITVPGQQAGTTPAAPGTSSAPAPGQASASSVAPVPSGAGVVDAAKPPNGVPLQDQPIPGNLWLSAGVTMSLDVQSPPAGCTTGTSLALRVAAPYGAFLTSGLTGATTYCNNIPIRFSFAKPVRTVDLEFAARADVAGPHVYQLLVTDASGAVQRLPTVAVDKGAASAFRYTAPGPPIVEVEFGHANPDPTAVDSTIVKRLVFQPA